MLQRQRTTTLADRKKVEHTAASHYLTTMKPELTSSDDSGLNDDLYAKRLLKQMLAELEATLPEGQHIVRLHYDSDPRGYTESIGVLLLVPAQEGNHSYAMRQHAAADKATNKAFAKVCDWSPDNGGVLLSTYGVLPDGTLVIDSK